jgi:hypothetical protein
MKRSKTSRNYCRSRKPLIEAISAIDRSILAFGH